MRKTVRVLWGVLCVLFLCACIARIVFGCPLQGIVGIAFGICLFPPLFDRIKSWRHPTLSAVGLLLGAALVLSPLPRKLSYKAIWNSVFDSNSTAVELTITPTSVIVANTTNTPTVVPTNSPSISPELTGVVTLTVAPTATVTNRPTAEPTETPTPIPTDTPTPAPASPTPTAAASLQVICLDVGQGDATLLLHTDHLGQTHTMMIDGGDRGTSSFVVARLSALGVTHLDQMVCTHYDADHCFGLIGCYVKYCDKTSTVYCPDYVADTVTYQKFVQRLDEGIVTVNHPKPGDSVPFGDCSITVLGPVDVNDAVENNRSIVLLLSYDGVSFYLPGDAEKGEESAILAGGLLPEGGVTVYHASHHGSYSASSAELLSVLKPTHTVISVGADNDYEHPHNVVLRRIAECGCANVLRTDLNGEVVFTVEDGTLRVSTER